MIRRWGAWIALGVVVVVALAVVLWPNGSQSPAARGRTTSRPSSSARSARACRWPTARRRRRGDPSRHQAPHRGRAERRRDPPGVRRHATASRSCSRRQDSGVGLLVWILPVVVAGARGRRHRVRAAAHRDQPHLHATEADERLVRAPSAMPERPRRRSSRSRAAARSSRTSATSCCGRSTTSSSSTRAAASTTSRTRSCTTTTPRAAAAVIRTLRDGVDVTPAPPPRSPTRTRRRVVLVGAVVVFALAAGTSLAYALGARLPGQTASGNSQAAPSTTNAAGRALAQKITELQAKVNASPDDYQLRLDLACAYEENGDLAERARSSPTPRSTIDANGPEAHANAARLLYLVSEVSAPTRRRSSSWWSRRWRVQRRRSPSGPTTPTATTSAPSCTRESLRDYARAQVDLQSYLCGRPTARGPKLRARCSPRSRRRSKPRRLRCHRRPRRGSRPQEK